MNTDFSLMEIRHDQHAASTIAAHAHEMEDRLLALDPVRLLRSSRPAPPPKIYYAAKWRAMIRKGTENKSQGHLLLKIKVMIE